MRYRTWTPLQRGPSIGEPEIRIAMALTILTSIVTGFIWFIAANLERIHNF